MSDFTAPRVVGSGPNDATMLEPENAGSNWINTQIDRLLEATGYDGNRRGYQGSPEDNSFYRDNASWMPGWPGWATSSGVPSGAIAQDRATNYVGHNDPTGVWNDVRVGIRDREQASIDAARARGDTSISFGDVYGAHVDAYADAQADARQRDPTSTAGNSFVDPLSFALAIYGAPMLENLGLNSGPITGASIDYFNDPTDSAGEGWIKRMGLAGGEMLAGAGAGFALGGPVGAALGALPGAFTAAWNTGTALNSYSAQEGLFGQDSQGRNRDIGDFASDTGMDARNWVQGATGNETLADIAEFATTGVTSVGGAVYSAGSAIVDGIGSAGSAIVDGIASW